MSCILYSWFYYMFVRVMVFLYMSIFIHALADDQSWTEFSTQGGGCVVSEPKAWCRHWLLMALLWHPVDVRRHFILWALFWHRLMVSRCRLTLFCPATHWHTSHPHHFSPCTKRVCGRSTITPLGVSLWWSPLLAEAGTGVGWSRSRNSTGTGNCGGESVWPGEISGVRVGLAPHFVWDAVTAFVTLLPVPRVAG